jgi:hypothetical protein
MEQAKVSDRRMGRNRRMKGTATYTGTEKRSLKSRRSGIDRRTQPAVCIYCGKVCGSGSNWSQGAATIETTTKCRKGICTDCSSNRFPQFYADT